MPTSFIVIFCIHIKFLNNILIRKVYLDLWTREKVPQIHTVPRPQTSVTLSFVDLQVFHVSRLKWESERRSYLQIMLVLTKSLVFEKIMPWSNRILLQHHQTKKIQSYWYLMSKHFLKHMPRCTNSRNLRFLHFFVIKFWIYTTHFSTSNSCRKLHNVQNEWSKLSIKTVFCYYKCNDRLTFAEFKSCIFENWPKWGWNRSFFSTVEWMNQRLHNSSGSSLQNPLSPNLQTSQTEEDAF